MKPTPPRSRELTPIEWRVATLAAQDLKDAAIAQELKFSPRKVQSHLRSAKLKLGILGRVGLGVYVMQKQRARTRIRPRR